MDSYFQISPEMSVGLIGCLTECPVTGTFTAFFLRHSCIFLNLKITVQLEGEPSAQSEVLTALDQVFKDIFAVFSSSSTFPIS